MGRYFEQAYCRNCEAVTSHRFGPKANIPEVVCNRCHWISIIFHEPVNIVSTKTLARSDYVQLGEEVRAGY